MGLFVLIWSIRPQVVKIKAPPLSIPNPRPPLPLLLMNHCRNEVMSGFIHATRLKLL